MRRSALVAVLVALTACGSETEPAATPSTTTTTAAPATTSTSTTLAPAPFEVPADLPASGIAVDGEDGVRLFALDGTPLGAVPGARLPYTTLPNAPLVLAVHEGYATWRLTDDGRLVPELPAADGVGVWPADPGPRYPDQIGEAGHWRWALPSPSGEHRLGQWSGECEVPATFFLGGDGTLTHVLGGDWTVQPVTLGLGWLPDGRALVEVVGTTGCGTASPEPGVYAIDPATGERERTDLPAGMIWSTPPETDGLDATRTACVHLGRGISWLETEDARFRPEPELEAAMAAGGPFEVVARRYLEIAEEGVTGPVDDAEGLQAAAEEAEARCAAAGRSLEAMPRFGSD